jgi:hypothetical protein
VVEGDLGRGGAVGMGDDRRHYRIGHRQVVLGERRGDRHRSPGHMQPLHGRVQGHPGPRSERREHGHGMDAPVRRRDAGAGDLERPAAGLGRLDMVAGIRQGSFVPVRGGGDRRVDRRGRRVDPGPGGAHQLEPQRVLVPQHHEDRRGDRVDNGGVGGGDTTFGDARAGHHGLPPGGPGLQPPTPGGRGRPRRRREHRDVGREQVVHDAGVEAHPGMVGEEVRGQVGPRLGIGQALHARHRHRGVVVAEQDRHLVRPRPLIVPGGGDIGRRRVPWGALVVGLHERGAHVQRASEKLPDLAGTPQRGGPDVGQETAFVRRGQHDQSLDVVVPPRVLPSVDPAFAVPEEMHPVHAEAPPQIGDRGDQLGPVVDDGALRREVDGIGGHVPGLEAVDPGGARPHRHAARAQAMNQEHRTPGQARLVLGLQGHPVDLERQGERFDVTREHKGDLVRPRYRLPATRLRRALPGTGVGREPHVQHPDVQPEGLPTGPEATHQLAE